MAPNIFFEFSKFFTWIKSPNKIDKTRTLTQKCKAYWGSLNDPMWKSLKEPMIQR